MTDRMDRLKDRQIDTKLERDKSNVTRIAEKRERAGGGGGGERERLTRNETKVDEEGDEKRGGIRKGRTGYIRCELQELSEKETNPNDIE